MDVDPPPRISIEPTPDYPQPNRPGQMGGPPYSSKLINQEVSITVGMLRIESG